MVAELDICHVSMGGINTFSVADPDPGSGAFLTPGSGSGIRDGEKSESGMNIPNRIYESLKTIFWV